MSPITSTLANGSAYGYRTLAAAAAGSFESIATATGTGSSGTVTFSSIPSTYKHLQLRILGKTTDSNGLVSLQFRFNSDTASNYAYHRLQGDGATASASGSASQTLIESATGMAGGFYADVFGAAIFDIHDYASTTKNKTTRMMLGTDRNGGGIIQLHSGLWMQTTAISSITVTQNGGANWATGSVFSLYGIKGA